MDMKYAPHQRVGIGQGFLAESEAPKQVVRVRSGAHVGRGSFVGSKDQPVAFVWAEEITEVPDRELTVQVSSDGPYLWENSKPVQLRDLFPNDKGLARLEKKLDDWQRYFGKTYNPRTPNRFWWGRFHEEGQRLARQLQAELIDKAVIHYRRPEQDPQYRYALETAL
jgi:hypothetical protein